VRQDAREKAYEQCRWLRSASRDALSELRSRANLERQMQENARIK